MSPDSPPEAPAPNAPGNRIWRGSLAFVVVFAVCVLSLLTAYRFAIDTTANDWYLFQVARHTAWVLEFIGEEATMEKHAAIGLNPFEVRALLRGEPVRQFPEGVTPGVATDGAPLSAWETWHYRALKNRSADERRETGPRISFILRPGLQHELESREETYRKLQEDPTAADSAAEASLKEEIASLRSQLSKSLADPAQRKARQGLAFTFIVIPECGAIEVMAIFLAAVLAYPASWRSRALGLLLGLPLMYLVNIFRLACLACIGALDADGRWFEFIHEYVWQAVYVIFVVMVWMAWAEFVVRRRN